MENNPHRVIPATCVKSEHYRGPVIRMGGLDWARVSKVAAVGLVDDSSCCVTCLCAISQQQDALAKQLPSPIVPSPPLLPSFLSPLSWWLPALQSIQDIGNLSCNEVQAISQHWSIRSQSCYRSWQFADSLQLRFRGVDETAYISRGNCSDIWKYSGLQYLSRNGMFMFALVNDRGRKIQERKRVSIQRMKQTFDHHYESGE